MVDVEAMYFQYQKIVQCQGKLFSAANAHISVTSMQSGLSGNYSEEQDEKC